MSSIVSLNQTDFDTAKSLRSIKCQWPQNINWFRPEVVKSNLHFGYKRIDRLLLMVEK